MSNKYLKESYLKEIYSKHKNLIKDIDLNYHFETKPLEKVPESSWKATFSFKGEVIHEIWSLNVFEESEQNLNPVIKAMTEWVNDYFFEKNIDLDYVQLMLLFNIEAGKTGENIYDIEIGGANFPVQTQGTMISWNDDPMSPDYERQLYQHQKELKKKKK